MWDPYAEFQTAVLPNGLSVYVAHWPDRPWVATTTLIHSGARLDNPGLEGTAHFVEHLCSRNANRPYNDVKRFFESVGGRVELGVTGYNFTYYQFFAPIGYITEALSIFGSMLVASDLNSYVEAQRAVILQEYHRSNRIPIETELKWRRHKSLYGDSWLSRFISPLGSPDSIDKILQADLKSYYDEHYTPANMIFLSVGGMSLDEVVGQLKESPFGIVKPGQRTLRPSPADDFPPPSENRFVFEFSKHVTLDKPLESGEYLSTAVLPGRVNEKALRVVISMLNQVLFEEVREKRGWTYSVGCKESNFVEFREFNVAANAIQLSSLDEIESVVDTCIASLAEREDLMREKVEQKINGFTMTDVTAKILCDGVRGDLCDDGRITTFAEATKLYAAIGIEDVREVLQWLRPERRRTSLTVP